MTLAPDGRPLIRVGHDPWCPAWLGITPSSTRAFAEAEAATGRTVIYVKEKP